MEDEDLMLRLLKKFFSRHGYVVLEASNGEQAIEVYRNNKQQIDAVLLDMRLPHKTGEEVFLEMKAENAAVNVVMASGFLEPQAKMELTRAGIKHFVSKPYELSELRKVFESLVEHQ
ncbi:MAG TPA: response regulator [Candidatus Binatia bacterium]|nr:response regulator [Candidatus Binatia bacterium]